MGFLNHQQLWTCSWYAAEDGHVGWKLAGVEHGRERGMNGATARFRSVHLSLWSHDLGFKNLIRSDDLKLLFSEIGGVSQHSDH